ncbi:aminotransferase class I/II-fold pyridoxal phosphate-dependent enzyme [Streptomyces endocoffeicus]|nr:aminotransferase class I/II-fold pyridoxal phosphate-dependent enzyme [Streptomyces endocoffeicus]
MTGWRVGRLAAPPEIIASARLHVARTITHVPTVNHRAALAAMADTGTLLRDRGWSSSADLAAWLLDTAHLAVVPGEAFNAPERIRMCFAVDDATLITAAERLRTALGPTEHEPAVQQLEEAR